MKKTLRVLFLTLLAAVSLCVFAGAYSGPCGDNLSWALEDGVLTISGNGPMVDWGGGANAAPWKEYSSQITDVVVEEGVTGIGTYAFMRLDELKSVTLPESLQSIGRYAFSWCAELSVVEIPAGVTRVGRSAFAGSVSEKFMLAEGNKNFKVAEGVLLTADGMSLLACPTGMEGDYAVPEGVFDISDQAFSGCEWIETLILPKSLNQLGVWPFEGAVNRAFVVAEGNKKFKADEDGVLFSANGKRLLKAPISLVSVYEIPEGTQRLEEYAFADCTDLTEIIIPEGVTYIGEEVFAYCPLTSVTIPASVTEIDDWAFSGCDELKTVYYGGTAADWESIEIGDDNDPLLNAELILGGGNDGGNGGNSITGECGDDLTWSFDGENGKLVITGSGETYDWDWGEAPWYEYAEGIRQVIVGEGVTDIGTNAFADCWNMEEVQLPDSLRTIGESAFEGCESLSDITLPEGVEYIGSYAFAWCSFAQMKIPASVYAIGQSAFVNSVWIGFEVAEDSTHYKNDERGILYTADGKMLLAAPWSLEGSCTVPEGVEYIADQAFSDCDLITTMILPASLQDLGWLSFDYAVRDAFEVAEDSRYFKAVDGVLYSAGGDILWAAPERLSGRFAVPEGVTYIKAAAFADCADLQFVEIPEGVEGLEMFAFYNCGNLLEVTIPASVKWIEEQTFYGCENLGTVYYGGTAADWETIGISDDNDPLLNAELVLGGGDAGGESGGMTGECGDDLTWSFDGESGELVISGEGEMWNWYAFGEYYAPWEPYWDQVKTVTVEEGVTSIGESAFTFYETIETVTLPESLTRIGEYAFFGNSALKEITIPAAVTEIGRCAFAASVSEGFAVAEGNSAYKDVEGVLYTLDGRVLMSYPRERNAGGLYHVAEGTEVIGECAFLDAQLIGVAMYDGVKEIFPEAFSNSAVEEIIVPVTMEFISGDAFYNCNALRTVYYDGSEAQWTSIAIEEPGNGCLLNATIDFRIKDEACGDALTWSFDGESGELVISGNGEMWNWNVDAGESAPWQKHSDGLCSVTVNEGVTSIGDGAFAFHKSIAEVQLPDSLTRIGSMAFANMVALERITIPAGVNEIGDYAFAGSVREGFTVAEGNEVYKDVEGVLFTADGKELITYPRGRNAGGLYHVPEGTEVIRMSAFVDDELLGVAMYDGLVKIDEAAFLRSTVEEIIVPVTVETIGAFAFSGCEKLHTVYYDGSEAQWNAIAIEALGNDCLLNATIDFRIKDDEGSEETANVTVTAPAGAEVTLNGETVMSEGAAVSFAVEQGTYDLQVKKGGCLTYTITGIAVEEGDIDLGTVKLLAGDTNGDGMINIMDMGVFRQNFGKMGAGIANAYTDTNGDNMVNIIDMSVFRSNFGKTARDCTVEYTA